MKKKYIKPNVEKFEIESCTIMCTSGEHDNGCHHHHHWHHHEPRPDYPRGEWGDCWDFKYDED